jgi:hypothetical protein
VSRQHTMGDSSSPAVAALECTRLAGLSQVPEVSGMHSVTPLPFNVAIVGVGVLSLLSARLIAHGCVCVPAINWEYRASCIEWVLALFAVCKLRAC